VAQPALTKAGVSTFDLSRYMGNRGAGGLEQRRLQLFDVLSCRGGKQRSERRWVSTCHLRHLDVRLLDG